MFDDQAHQARVVERQTIARDAENNTRASPLRPPAGALGPAALFLVAGTLHIVRPGLFRPIVPPAFGHAAQIVAISGAAELAGGAGLLYARTRRAAAYALVALLVAVWPANWYMALATDRFAAIAPAWALWLRVPLQIPLVWWVLATTLPPDGGVAPGGECPS